jgi:hypothetical protein
MKLSISIMAHPSREKFIPYLKEKLGEVPVSMDIESKGLIWNCLNAWKMFDPTADLHVVIQDDAIVCNNFKEKAEKIIEQYVNEYPTVMTCFNFYYGTRVAFRQEATEGLKAGYIIKDRPCWGVAICLPTKLIPEFIKYYEHLHDRQDDTRISRFLKSRNIPVYFPMPSLIDHRAELESLVGNAFSPGRKAYKFIENI